MSNEIRCHFTGQIKYSPELRHSEKSGRTWCRLRVMVAAGTLGDIGVLSFGRRAVRVCETMRAGDVVEVEGRLSLWSRDGLTQELSVISSAIRQPGDPSADVTGHRARHADAEVTLGEG